MARGYFIGETDRMHQRPNGMESIRPPVKDPENQIHFGRGDNTKTGRVHSQITGAALIPASFDFVFSRRYRNDRVFNRRRRAARF